MADVLNMEEMRRKLAEQRKPATAPKSAFRPAELPTVAAIQAEITRITGCATVQVGNALYMERMGLLAVRFGTLRDTFCKWHGGQASPNPDKRLGVLTVLQSIPAMKE